MALTIAREAEDWLDDGPSAGGRPARSALVVDRACPQRFPSPRTRRRPAPARARQPGNATTFRNDTKGYNADNQLTSPGTFVYDGNGNPTTFGGTTLTFDPENRLTAYGSTLTAGYRGDNLRAWKETTSGRTWFLYDGINVVCELDGSGNVTAQSVFGANGLLSRGSVQYQFDPLGDATLLLDGSENVTAHRLFDAWGNELSSGSTDPRGYRAKYGYYTDVETGLVALAYRYYAPGMGRFVNRDPIGRALWLHLYSYAGNEPVAKLDPRGLYSCESCWEGLAICEEGAALIAATLWALATAKCMLELLKDCIHLPPLWNLACGAAVTAVCAALTFDVFERAFRIEQAACAVAFGICMLNCGKC